MFTKGHTGWNKGLTKETDHRVKLNAEKISDARKGCTFTEEHKTKLSQAKLGTHPTEVAREKRSQSMKLVWANPSNRNERSKRLRKVYIPRKILENLYLVKGYTITQIARHLGYDFNTIRKHFTEYRISLKPHGWAIIGRQPTAEERGKLSLALKGRKFQRRKPQEEVVRTCRERTRKKWKDPEYVLKQLKARGAKPNKPERYLENILNNHFPEYQYNGDGRLGIVLAGLVPDFPNVNGKKQVIEVFGDYFHNPRKRKLKWHQTELGRIMAYNSVGFDCLVIWEHELKELTEGQIIEKVKSFSRR